MPQKPSLSKVLLSSTLLASLLAMNPACSPQAAKGARQGQVVPVQVAKVLQGDLPRTQIAVGTVRPIRSVAIKPQVDGVIRKIHFTEGALVQEGQLLVSLDQRPFQNALQIARAELLTAKAEYEKAKADADRYSRLKSSQGVSEELYALYFTKRDTCEALVLAREASLADAELKLSYTEIRAPFPGRVGQLSLHEGSVVKANDNGSLLLTINQVCPIEVGFTVPEAVLPELRRASSEPVKVTVRRQEGGEDPKEGLLSFIDNNIDNTTGTLSLRAEFPNTDEALWPGQFVDVRVLMGSDKAALLVPLQAVQNGQQGTQCFVVKEDQTVELRKVSVGRNSEGLALITAGLSAGETVVTDGQLRLEPGSKVKVREPAGGAASPAKSN